MVPEKQPSSSARCVAKGYSCSLEQINKDYYIRLPASDEELPVGGACCHVECTGVAEDLAPWWERTHTR